MKFLVKQTLISYIERIPLKKPQKKKKHNKTRKMIKKNTNPKPNDEQEKK